MSNIPWLWFAFQERYTVTRLSLHPSLPQFLAQTQAGYAAVFSTQRPYKMNKNKRFEGHKVGQVFHIVINNCRGVLYFGVVIVQPQYQLNWRLSIKADSLQQSKK